MKVVSLSVGRPRRVERDGATVLTSIDKTLVDQRLRVTTLNIEGRAVRPDDPRRRGKGRLRLPVRALRALDYPG